MNLRIILTISLFKTEECNKNGADLMHIFEDEYLEHKDIVLNRLNYAFNYQSNNLICNIFEISEYDAENFLTKNHLQGFKPSTIYLGSYSNNRLLGVMSFDKCDNYCNFEITRFAVNEIMFYDLMCKNLFQHFLTHYQFKNVFYLADRRWIINKEHNIYTDIGFKIDSIIEPNFTYVVGSKRSTNYEDNVHKIWDCGYVKYSYKK